MRWYLLYLKRDVFVKNTQVNPQRVVVKENQGGGHGEHNGEREYDVDEGLLP